MNLDRRACTASLAIPRSQTPAGPFRAGACALLAALGLLAACAAPSSPGDGAIARGGPANGRALVVVIDVSAEGEPVRGPAKACLEVALGLAVSPEESSPVAVLVASTEGATLLSGLEPVGEEAARNDLVARAASRPRQERRALGRGARRAHDLLVAAQAPRGSLVLLLSGPETTDRELTKAAGDLAQRGYRVVRAPLESGDRAALAEMAREAFGYLAATGTTSRLVVGGGRVATVAFDAGAARVTHLPVPASGGTIALPPGDDRVVLHRPPWELALDPDAPPPVATIGDPVPVVARIEGPSADLDVQATGPAGPIRLVKAGRPGALRFEGDAPPATLPGPQELSVSVRFRAGDATFELSRRARWIARARQGLPPPELSFSPARLDLGTAWVGSRVAATLVLTGDPGRATQVSLETGAWANAVAPVALAAGESRRVELLVDPARVPDGARLQLRSVVVEAPGASVRPIAKGERAVAASAPEIPPRLASVPVALEARTATLPERFEVTALLPGATSQGDWRVAVTPRASLAARVVLEDARGVEVTPTLSGDRLEVVARASPDAKPGERRGRVEISLAGAATGPLVRPFAVTVLEPPRALALELEPRDLKLVGRGGWAEGRVQVSASREALLEVKAAPLAAGSLRILPRRDIRAVAADARWDARTLAKDEARTLVVRVYVRSDLPAGRYEGSFELSLEEPDGKRVAVPLPVSVVVER